MLLTEITDWVTPRPNINPYQSESTGPAYLTDGRSAFQINGLSSQQLRRLFSSNNGMLSAYRNKFHILDSSTFTELFDTHQRFTFSSPQEFLQFIQQK